jgi:hypothetical protein
VSWLHHKSEKNWFGPADVFACHLFLPVTPVSGPLAKLIQFVIAVDRQKNLLLSIDPFEPSNTKIDRNQENNRKIQ